MDQLQNDLQLTPDEIRVLAKWLEKQSLPYDNYELHAVVGRICRAQNELDRIISLPTPRGGESG